MYRMIMCEFEDLDSAEIASLDIKNNFKGISKITLKYKNNAVYNGKTSGPYSTIPPQSIYNSAGTFGGVAPFELASNITDIDNNTDTHVNKSYIFTEIGLGKSITKADMDKISTKLRNMNGKNIKII